MLDDPPRETALPRLEPAADKQPRRRSTSPDIVLARAGRRLAAPLSAELPGWHAQVARLQARVARTGRNPESLEDIRHEATALRAVVARRLAEWKQTLERSDPAGYVSDTERSCSDVIARLNAVLAGIPVAPRPNHSG